MTRAASTCQDCGAPPEWWRRQNAERIARDHLNYSTSPKMSREQRSERGRRNAASPGSVAGRARRWSTRDELAR